MNIEDKTNDDFSKKKEKLSNEQRNKKRKQKISQSRANIVENIFSVQNNNGIVSISDDEQDINSKNLVVSETINTQSQQIHNKESEIKETITQLISLGKGITSKQITQLLKCLSMIPNQNSHPNSVVQFSLNQNILPNLICDKCKQQLKLGQHKKYIEKCVWRCYSKCCDKSRFSLYHKHRIFSRFRCNLLTLLKLFLQYLPTQAFVSEIQRELDLDKTTITNARQMWQSIVRHYYQKFYAEIQLGADTSVVEADEACFRRKYNRGRLLKRNQWVFGVMEREGGFERTIFIPVAKRNKPTLTSLIKQFVSTDCPLFITDMWRGYSGIKELAYEHLTINHSQNFVQPSNNNSIKENNKTKNKNNNQIQSERKYLRVKGHLIHTQSIENRWTHVKQRLKRLKGQRKNYLNDMFDSLFYLSHKDNIEKKSLDIIIDYINNIEQQQTEEFINQFDSLSLQEESQLVGNLEIEEGKEEDDDDDDGAEEESNIYVLDEHDNDDED